MVEVGIIFGGLLVCFLALTNQRSKRVPDNVVQFVPKSKPPRAEVRAAGQVIEFKPKESNTK